MAECREFVDASAAVAVRGFLHTPRNPTGEGLVLAHGAGTNCQSPLLFSLARACADSGLTVLRIDLPFRQLRPHGPPPRGSAEEDQRGLRRAIEVMRQQIAGRVFIGGHSYGGRMGSMLATSEPGLVHGLLLLSYPLHPPKRREQLRTAHFPDLQTPALFVSGTRDGFGSTGELESAIKLIPARTRLLTIPEAGHELLTKKNRDDLPEQVVSAFFDFFGRRW